MQPVNEMLDEKLKKNERILKSNHRMPKQIPSYIVAFAIHETYDDIVTAQQMICNKRSLQSSTGSMSSAISSKTLDHNSVPKTPSSELTKILNESKTKVDIEENSYIYDNIQNDLPETTDYLVVDNKEEDDGMNRPDSCPNLEIKQTNKQLNRLLKKKRQTHSRNRNLNYNFKYKKSKKREEKASKNPACAAKIKETFYSDSVSKVVSRSSLLKKAVVDEKILGTVDSKFSDEDNNNDESLQSSPSTAKKSFISYSSEGTLTRHGSISSKNDDFSSIGTISSVIKIPSQRTLPYKTEVINVSVAVAYNPPTNNNERNPPSEPYRSIYPNDLLSTETLVEPTSLLASDSLSSETSDTPNVYLQNMNMNISDGTIKPTSENTFVIRTTSSEAEESLQSDSTLAPNSETFMYEESLRQTPPTIVEKPEKDKNYNRVALLDTVINMGIFPEITPSTSSAMNLNNDFNGVFVTKEADQLIKNTIFAEENLLSSQKDSPKCEIFNTLKKSFDADKDINHVKNLSLPNESTIKAIINETDKIEAKFWSEELANCPGNITQLWDKIVLVVDSAVKRLEHSLTEKIINEIKNQQPSLENKTRIKEEVFVVDVEKVHGEKEFSHKEVFVDRNEMAVEVDESLQCTLVGNKVIDSIVTRMSIEGPKTSILNGPVAKSYPKVKRSKVIKDFFEVLKPPTVESELVEGKGDTVTVSTTSPSEIEQVESSSREKSIFAGPLAFLKENMMVLTSVPTFFVMLLCVYGIIIFLMKPW